jgi:hypothetical protein
LGLIPIFRSVPSKIDLDQNQEAELLRLQRLTAQRADQLAASGGARPSSAPSQPGGPSQQAVGAGAPSGRTPPLDDLAIWLRAEQEVFGASLVASG